LAGDIPQFSGVSDPYEAPLNPEIKVSSEKETIDESLAKILGFLEKKGYISKARTAAKA
jgi:adenylylsulfate kinase